MRKPPRSAALGSVAPMGPHLHAACFVRPCADWRKGQFRRQRRRPRLIVSSHRNGAIDGALVQAAFPHAQYLVSMQLLRGPLRLLFTGIPVIRHATSNATGWTVESVNDPVSAGVDHLTAGGTWCDLPRRHQRMAAHSGCVPARRREESGADYGRRTSTSTSSPWASSIWRRSGSVRSRNCGAVRPSICQESIDGPRIEREKRAHRRCCPRPSSTRYSVHCPDPQTFNSVQQRATARARAGESFAESFLDEQAAAVRGETTRAFATDSGPATARGGVPRPSHGLCPGPGPRPRPQRRPRARRRGLDVWGWPSHWLFAPVLNSAWSAGTKPDARNTVTFFRSLGGSAGVVIWLLVLVSAAVWVVLAGASVRQRQRCWGRASSARQWVG